VAETITPTTENPRTGTATRIGWAILIVLTLYVCYFSHLGAIGFVGPDEPRYAWIARDMMETGDWVTPRLYGKPWFEKPPLFYWGAALCFKTFGVSEAAARLPSAISALLATLALAWLALRLYGAETARWLLLLLPTTVGMIGFSHAAATDMPFSGMLTIAMVCAAVILGLTRSEHTPILPCTPWLALILFGFFLGLAVLAKGPAAIILCGGTVFFWALFTKRWRDAFRLFHPAALASFCLTALPWYILCARRNPGFFHVFIVEHNFKRYLTPEFQHIQPFWYYGPIVLLGLLPWTIIFVGAIKDGRCLFKDSRWALSPSLFFACAAIWPVLFFSLSKSKLPGYILPAIPFFVLILARSLSLDLGADIQGGRGIAMGSAATLIALGLLAIFQIERIPLVWTASALTLAGFSAFFLASVRRIPFATIVSVITFVAAIFLALVGDSRWAIDTSSSSRYAVQSADVAWKNFSPEGAVTYRLPRSFQYSLNFYFHRELREWSPDKAHHAWVFTSMREVSQLRDLGLDCRFSSPLRAVIVCEASASADRADGGGQSHKKE
jgi:4-amino-4-deoxy-L-arabinose transferase-like glycosyltransferase